MRNGAAHFLYRRRTAPIGDKGTILNIVSWILLAVVGCTLVARFAMKLSMKTKRRRLGLDDLFIGLATLFSIGQTVAVSIESINVLGQHVHDLTLQQELIFQKAEYASCILYIANMGCARISVCLLISKVLPGVVPKYTALVFAAFTVLWTVSGVLATAFACHVPDPWRFLEKRHCMDVLTFVNYIGGTNIVVEVLLVILPLIVWNVRLSAGRRISVSLVFVARLSIVAAVSAHLYFFNRSPMADDYSYSNWSAVLCQQIAQNLSIISACLPCLHPFIIGILAGTTEPETIPLNYGAPSCIKQYMDRKFSASTASQSSHGSITRLADDVESHCRPLATHGLIRSSAHAHSNSSTHFPANIAETIFTPQPPQNVFNRPMDVPYSRPGTSKSATDPLAPPKHLSDVGVLPAINWDTESEGSRKSSPTRQPTAEYVFNRQKVISVPDEPCVVDEGHKWYAPLPSPRFLRKPPRAF